MENIIDNNSAPALDAETISASVKIVSLGPGDAGLITVKGLKALTDADFVYCPGTFGRDGVFVSRAKDILYELGIPKHKIRCFGLPMAENTAKAEEVYDRMSAEAESVYHAGRRICITAEGDVGMYSSVNYLFDRLRVKGIPAELVPGIPSFIAACACAGIPLVTRSERLTVIPGTATVQDIERTINDNSTAVIMKPSKCASEIRRCIALHADYTYHYFENIGTDRERHVSDAEAIALTDYPYFSLLVIK